jgi:hypothetical protein
VAVTVDEPEVLDMSPVDPDPLLSVALLVEVVVEVWVDEVDPDACACCESWTTRPTTPPTPTTTMPTVACFKRRVPRARTLSGRCVDVMSSVVPLRTEQRMTAICASAVNQTALRAGR